MPDDRSSSDGSAIPITAREPAVLLHQYRMTTYRRRETREKALQALYAFELSKDPIASVMDSVLGDLKEHRDEFDFAKKLVMEVVNHKEEIESIIREKVDHWEFNRIAVIDRMLLRMGICELLYFQDIPPKVTINESIEIAKAFSTEKSGQFINGVLDSVLDELKAKKTLHKTGRGLIDSSAGGERKPRPYQDPPQDDE